MRLRGFYEALTPAFIGHEVSDLEWIEVEGELLVPEDAHVTFKSWQVRADHDYETCHRCALHRRAKNAILPTVDPNADPRTLANQAASFYSDDLVEWSDEPDLLDPSPAFHRATDIADETPWIGKAKLREWLVTAIAYVRARMALVETEEAGLATVRAIIHMRLANEREAAGTLDQPRNSAGPATADGDDLGVIWASLKSAKSPVQDGYPRQVGGQTCYNRAEQRSAEVRQEIEALRTKLSAVSRELQRGA